jgi:hypothetical protein
MTPTSQLALPFACLFTLATAATACAMDDRSKNMASDETRSQQEIGKQIVTDTKRHQSQTESGSQAMRQQSPSESMTESQPTTEDQQRVSQQMAESGNAMGVPEPGSVQDQESTQKQRRPEASHEKRSQATVSGAKYFVYGDVIRIDGDNFFVRDADSGDEVKLLVNQDTNLDCGSAPQSGGTMSTEREQAAGGTERQRAQGQRPDETAAGSGFKAGDCHFKTGDKVKAEVSDVGTVTTLKFMQPGSGTPSATTRMQGTPPQNPSENVSETEQLDRSPSGDRLKKQAEGKEAPSDLRQ